MNIDDLTVGQLKEIAKMTQAQPMADDSHWIKGKIYFIRTVTHHLTGRLIKVTNHEIVVEDAAWIADDGSFSEAIKKSEFNEVEPYPDGIVIIGRSSLIDACEISKIQRSKK